MTPEEYSEFQARLEALPAAIFEFPELGNAPAGQPVVLVFYRRTALEHLAGAVSFGDEVRYFGGTPEESRIARRLFNVKTKGGGHAED